MVYPPKQWFIIKTAYETIDDTIPKLLKKTREEHPEYRKWPYLSAVMRKMTKEGWKKRKNDPIVEKSHLEQQIALYASYGLTKASAAEIVAKGALTQQTGIQAFEKSVQELSASTGENGATVETITTLKAIVDRFLNDMGLSLKFVQEYHKVCGMYAPVKVEKTVDKNVTHRSLDGLSHDELAKRVAQIVKHYIRRRVEK